MAYVKITDGNPARYSLRQLRADHPMVTFPADPSEDALAEFGVFPLARTERPEETLLQRIVEGAPAQIDGVWQQVWTLEPLPLDDAKAAMRRAIDDKRDTLFTAGFTVTSTSTALDGHTLQTRDEGDKINWLTSQAAYAAAIAGGFSAIEGATFRTASNDTIVLTYAEGHAVLLAMAEWGKAIMGNSWALKDAVESAAYHEALDLIDLEAGWP